MSLSLLHPPRALAALALVSLLSGCSVHGTYPDATEPDAAKLRFISNTSNTTLDIYDAQHCTGQTTGMLNNFLMADTKRRADMLVPPPAKARGLLEIKLAPGKDTMLMINTNGGSYVCGKSFNLTPKAGEEYEVIFDLQGGRCSTLLQRLSRLDGKDVRIPQPLFETGMPSCQGKGPIFGKLLPDTPQRTVLIDRIIEERAQLITAIVSENKVDRMQTSPQELDELIAKRKALMGSYNLPPDYWNQYRQNYELSNKESAGRITRALGLYTDVYRLRLRGTEDAILEQWMQPKDSAIKVRVAENDKLMLQYYGNARKSVTMEVVNHHMERMAQLDQRFDVCAHFDKCARY
ncbi:hypothetical protein [Pseudomonas sp. K2I15]|uniref:hypothetical protein n=1 Tax=Pseudomonas sp. K2I15 TaxID=2013577 RepID=UPI000B4C2D0F|nr:hypothetical protein [Pseudomonas sp. K2I15]OWP73631.1 hypothetical protein CEC48_00655 [Pseudomonas sp. K2I15]